MFVTRLTLKGRSSTPPDPEANKITIYATDTGDVRALDENGDSLSLLGRTANTLNIAGDIGIYVVAGVPVDYTDGSPPATGEAEAGPGSLAIDISNSDLYINTGTKAHPAWTKPA